MSFSKKSTPTRTCKTCSLVLAPGDPHVLTAVVDGERIYVHRGSCSRRLTERLAEKGDVVELAKVANDSKPVQPSATLRHREALAAQGVLAAVYATSSSR